VHLDEPALFVLTHKSSLHSSSSASTYPSTSQSDNAMGDAVITEPKDEVSTPMSSETSLANMDTGKELAGRSSSMSSREHGYEDSQPQQGTSETWDFKLPTLPRPVVLQPTGPDSCEVFSMLDLLGAIQNGTSHEDVKTYISHYQSSDSHTISQNINSNIRGFPPMLYVVAANSNDSIRLFAKLGADVNVTYGSPPIPLIGFALIHGTITEQDTTSTVATLLSLGADSDTIPKAFYSPYDEDLPSGGPADETLADTWENERTTWCNPSRVRKLLAESMNMTQRYYLHRSSILGKPTSRQWWVAARHDSTELFAVPYFLIGQSAAVEQLTKIFLHYMLRCHDQPLVLVFAGPSGHGKTELARRLGDLLSLDLHVSDCTIVTKEMELFGPRKPYTGAREGSPLNNFLAANNGRRSIVFLDEFEKTTADIWNALLIPFDKGEISSKAVNRYLLLLLKLDGFKCGNYVECNPLEFMQSIPHC
jgi:hypothetical protein